jgi:predicted nucleic acid-binding protein
MALQNFGTFFWLDASALLKLVLAERGSEELQRVVQQAGCVYTTSFCFGEAFGILKVRRFGKRQRISQEVYIRTTNYLRSCIKSNCIKFEEASILNPTVFFEAASLSDRYGVDLADALQVITIKRSMIVGATLITADKELAKAARTEGVLVWDCEKEAAPFETYDA